MFMVFSDVTRSTAPTNTDFATGVGAANSKAFNDSGATNGTRAGGVSGGGNRFEQETGLGNADMDAMALNTQRHVWFYLRLPNSTSVTAVQRITVTLTAVPAT